MAPVPAPTLHWLPTPMGTSSTLRLRQAIRVLAGVASVALVAACGAAESAGVSTGIARSGAAASVPPHSSQLDLSSAIAASATVGALAADADEATLVDRDPSLLPPAPAPTMSYAACCWPASI